MRFRTWMAAMALAFAAAPASAQSLFNAAGIGLPIEALDARARGAGSLGIGLPGTNLLPVDPASAARTLIPGGSISAQPTWVDFSRSGTTGQRHFRGSRFPLFAAGYPMFGGVATLNVSSFLDQGYTGERIVTVDLSGTPTEARDRFEQDGAVSLLNVGFARMVGRTTSVGVSVGRYTGQLQRSLRRSFGDSLVVNQTVLPYGTAGTWSYHGYQLSLGVSSDVGGLVRVAASATVSSDLKAVATSSTPGTDRSFSLPLQLRVGASSQLAPGVTINASAARADWSGIEDDLGGGAQASATTSFGGGLEMNRGRLFNRAMPIRLGYRRVGLPFSLDGGSAHEQAFTGGLGLALNETNQIVLAAVDLGVEKGKRVGGAYREDFWRATVSLKLLGF